MRPGPRPRPGRLRAGSDTRSAMHLSPAVRARVSKASVAPLRSIDERSLHPTPSSDDRPCLGPITLEEPPRQPSGSFLRRACSVVGRFRAESKRAGGSHDVQAARSVRRAHVRHLVGDRLRHGGRPGRHRDHPVSSSTSSPPQARASRVDPRGRDGTRRAPAGCWPAFSLAPCSSGARWALVVLAVLLGMIAIAIAVSASAHSGRRSWRSQRAVLGVLVIEFCESCSADLLDILAGEVSRPRLQARCSAFARGASSWASSGGVWHIPLYFVSQRQTRPPRPGLCSASPPS